MRSAEGQIVFISLGLIFIVLVVTSIVLSALRHKVIVQSLTSLSNLALVLSEQTDRAFQAVTYVQRDMIETVTEEGVTNRETFKARLSARAIHQLMRDRVAGLPFLDAMSLIDDTGQIISTTRVWPAPVINIADRGFFQKIARSRDIDLAISRPLPGRITNRPSLFLARRISAPDGTFLGMVVGILDQSVFDANFAKVDLGPGGLIALVRDDGTILSDSERHAAGAAEKGQKTRLTMEPIVSSPQATQILPAGSMDDASRFAAISRVRHFPVTMVVTETTHTVDGRVLNIAMPVLLSAILLCLLICIVAFFFARQLRMARDFATQEHRQAREDILTGLPNRLYFAEYLRDLLARPEAPPSALLYLDLNYFKSVNDTLGHDVGDAALQVVAKRMAGVIGEKDTLARLGGDEFAIVRENVTDEQQALALADSLIATLREPVTIGSHRIQLICSIGIALCPQDGTTPMVLLKKADLALYQAKAAGHGTVRLYVADLGRELEEKNLLQMELQEAWQQRQFTLWYQPIFDTLTLRLAGFEALLRWPHPTRGMIPPDRFIPLAEDTGLIVPIGAWVLEEACRKAAQWPDDLFISVNLSPIQLRDDTALAQIRAAIEVSRLPGRRLEVEITESLLIESGPSVRNTLAQLQNLGICIALDDFGTGYSSLSCLESLRINRIKLDRSFVSNLHDPRGRSVVHAMLQLAHALKLRSTAEGVETQEQVEVLRSEGCTHLQGFLLGRPVPAEDADRCVRQAAP